MTDSHQLIEAWLAEGGIGDPPRELAVHATVCASCARRIGAFDSLAAVNVGAAGSPPPLTAPSPFWLLLARGRAATTIAATVAAGILVVFGASQLIGSIGPPSEPGPSQVAVATTPNPDDKQVDGHGPQPAEEPSVTSEPPSDPIASFVPLPTPSPNAAPLAAPRAPFLSPNGVGYYTVAVRWTASASGGLVQKWELWRQTGSGSWVKLGELPASVRAFTNGGLAPGTTYSYRVRAVNVTGSSGFSNTASATTLVPPTAAPTPTASPTPTPEPTPTPPPTPTPEPPTPPPTPTPEPPTPPPTPTPEPPTPPPTPTPEPPTPEPSPSL